MTCWCGFGSAITRTCANCCWAALQVEGVQRTETFLSLADLDADNVTAGRLELMRERLQALG